MNYKRLFPESDFIEIKIKWKKPILLKDIKKSQITNDELGYFYKIIGKRGDKYKLFYIGKTNSQYISQRLLNQDHILKQDKMKKDHPGYVFYLSVGLIDESCNKMPYSINNVESLLIYAHCHEDNQFFTNNKNTLKHNVIKNYRIINLGFGRREWKKR